MKRVFRQEHGRRIKRRLQHVTRGLRHDLAPLMEALGQEDARMSPAVSKKQQRLMGADLARKRKGKKTITGLSEAQLKDFASTKTTDLPTKKKKKAHK